MAARAASRVLARRVTPTFAAACALPARRDIRGAALTATVTSCPGFPVFAGLVAVGLRGATDPMHSLLTPVFRSGVRVALPPASPVLGNLWRAVNPRTGPVRLLRRPRGRPRGVGLARLGRWPAVTGLFGFTRFTLASLAPEAPRVLAQTAALCWASVFPLAVPEGEDRLDRGGFLTVRLTAPSRSAPPWPQDAAASPAAGRPPSAGPSPRGGGEAPCARRGPPRRGRCSRWRAGPPAAQVPRLAPVPPSAAAFVTPEFAGRSAVQGVIAAGLPTTRGADRGRDPGRDPAGRRSGRGGDPEHPVRGDPVGACAGGGAGLPADGRRGRAAGRRACAPAAGTGDDRLHSAGPVAAVVNGGRAKSVYKPGHRGPSSRP